MARQKPLLFAFILTLLTSLAAMPALAETPPPVITPLSAVPDPNDVNITDGKARLHGPTISIPAAPRLAFDLIQNNMPYLFAHIGTGAPVTSSISVHYGAGSAAAFQCHDDDVCNDRKASGAVIDGAIANGGPYTFTANGSGAVYQFDKLSLNSGYGTGNWQVMYYASSAAYPDGEAITYTYDTASYSSGQGAIQYRLTKMSSNIGYELSVTYQGTDVNYNEWRIPAQVTLVKTSNPTVPLARLIYTTNGSILNQNVTDLAGRVYNCVSCDNRAIGQVELTNASVTLPGDATAAEALQGSGYVVDSVTKDGVGWSYAYTNFRMLASPEGYGYDKLTVTGPTGYNQVYNILAGYDDRPNLITSSVDSIGRTTSYEYDTKTRLTKLTMPEGNYVQIGYDMWGNVTSKLTQPKSGSGQSALSESATYDTAGCSQYTAEVRCYRMTSYTDALGRTTNYTYDTGGRLTSETAPADSSGVRRVKYLSYGSSFTAPTLVRVCGLGTTCGTSAEIQTQYTYWGSTALPATETRVDGVTGTSLTTAYTYDNAGRLLIEDGPLPGTGDAKYFRYDVLGRKAWEIGAANADGTRPATRYTYRDPDDKVVATETGTIPDPYSASLSVAARVDTSYDGRRYPIQAATSPSAGGTVYKVNSASFDDRGQQICGTVRMNQAAFGSLPADACALGTQGSNGPDRITHNIYDTAGQLLQIQKAYGTSLQQNYATYTYSPNGKQASVTDANRNLASLAYDGFDRLKQWTFPSKTTPGQVNASDYESYGYDAAGNRTSLRKRDGVTLTYQYDGLNRVTVKSVPASASGAAGYNVYYGYDVRGPQTYARFGSPSGEGVTSTYDGFGRLTASTTAMSGTSRTLSYQYDVAGNRTQVLHPDGVHFDMAYDAGDRMTGANWTTPGWGTTPFLGIGYDDLGRRTSTIRASSGSYYSYDPISRLSVLTQGFAGGAGNLTTGFGYNPASQIVTQSRDNDDYRFTGYVAADRGYGVNGLNQYTTAGPATFAYDANGNLTSDGVNAYVYDAENRLVSSSQNAMTLAYDPLGRLWMTSSSTLGVTQFLSDDDHVALEYDGATGAVRRRFMWGPGVDEPILQDEGAAMNCSATRFLHTDHQGSIVAVADCPGNRVNVDSYDEYGIPAATNWGRFQYTGQAWLADLGMYYYKARMYSPTLGRFMQTDPIGYQGGLNIYAYTGDDPVDGTDPSGTQTGSGCTGTLICPDGNTLGATTKTLNPGLQGAGTSDGAGRVRSDGGSNGGSSRASPSQSSPQNGNSVSSTLAVAAGALVADDVTGIGVADDPLAAVLGVGAAAALAVETLKTHGNSLQSDRKTYVYELVGPKSQTMKYGITSNPVAERRYTASFYANYDVTMRIIATYNYRFPARAHEFGLCMGYVASNGGLPPLSARC